MNKKLDEPLLELEQLCSFTTIYFTTHYRRSSGEESVIITASNNPPSIVENEDTPRRATWEKSDIAIDLYSLSNIGYATVEQTETMWSWINIICSILTFKGHEIIHNGNLFKPFLQLETPNV